MDQTFPGNLTLNIYDDKLLMYHNLKVYLVGLILTVDGWPAAWTDVEIV